MTDATPSRQDAISSLEQDVGRLVRTARRVVAKNADAFDPGMQPTTYLVLRTIVRRQPVRPADIATETGMDKSFVSRQLKPLAEAGFVVSVANDSDGRVRAFSATPEAEARLTAIRSATHERFGRALDAWSDDDVVRFAQLLSTFNDEVTIL